MYIKVDRLGLFVRPTGEVIDEQFNKVIPTENPLGELVLKRNGYEALLKDLVMAHHGEPPEKGRYPAADEHTVCIDGNEENCTINNLVIKPKEKQAPTASDLTEEHEKAILELIRQRTKYSDIVALYEKEGVALTEPQISKIKAKYLKKGASK